MEYEVHTIPFNKAVLDPNGVIEPLCNSCACPDCTNPIREQTVSLFGLNKQFRLYVVNKVCRQVVQCQGYVGDKDAPLSDFSRST